MPSRLGGGTLQRNTTAWRTAMPTTYDCIVIGACCAGSPTAMLLARRGYRVLVLDRAGFPSDTLSTHVIQPKGVATLNRWGLLDAAGSHRLPAGDEAHVRLRAFHSQRHAACRRRELHRVRASSNRARQDPRRRRGRGGRGAA